VPLFSLRSETSWGCGDVTDLPRFARWAARAGISLVQLLPVNETTGADASPYAACSAFALDPVFLGLDACEDFERAGGRKALPPPLRKELDALAGCRLVDWPRVRALKEAAAHVAFERFLREEWSKKSRRAKELAAFRAEQRGWLEDYALFAVLHRKYGKAWSDWPQPLRERVHSALERTGRELELPLLERAWLQWQLDLQWRRARAEAQSAGVDLMGDLPFVVGNDSADVWAHPADFRADLRVGTPPDDFSETGQDWGLPAYNWDELRTTEFGWIRARAARAGALFSAYRVDHVLGFYRTYVRGPDGSAGFWPAHEAAQISLGETVLRAMRASAEVIAEDLGEVPPFLRPSLERLRVPGYRVLRWEKDGNVYRDPAGWPRLSVATNGTHDTDSTADWFDALSAGERAALGRVPGLALAAARPRFDDGVRDAILATLYRSPSELVIVPFADLRGERDRINVPGTVCPENWSYRLPVDLAGLEADRATSERLLRLAVESNRWEPAAGAEPAPRHAAAAAS
jgi:4-alpha-glucanotransferase